MQGPKYDTTPIANNNAKAMKRKKLQQNFQTCFQES
jgi:hypothetical protein